MLVIQRFFLIIDAPAAEEDLERSVGEQRVQGSAA